jgi:hypothetical protein
MLYRLSMLLMVLGLLIVPVFAQDTAPNTLTFNGFSFQSSATWGNDVHVMQYPGDEPTGLAGAEMPPYTLFTLYERDVDRIFPNPAPESAFDAKAGIYVFNTADFEGHTEMQTREAALRSMMDERPDLNTFETVDATLPYIPVYAAAQTFRAQAHYIETPQLQGIAYITDYQEAVEPFLSNSLYYTVQAISTDGEHYITVIVPLETSLLPENTDASFDIAAFVENLNDYLAQTMADIDVAAATDFSPALDTIDALIATFAFEGNS